MTVTVTIPDSVAQAFAPPGADISRAVLEAMALEGYRGHRLTESQVRRMLGFETRMEVHGFLKDRGVFMEYTMDDVRRDTAVALATAQKAQSESETGKIHPSA